MVARKQVTNDDVDVNSPAALDARSNSSTAANMDAPIVSAPTDTVPMSMDDVITVESAFTTDTKCSISCWQAIDMLAVGTKLSAITFMTARDWNSKKMLHSEILSRIIGRTDGIVTTGISWTGSPGGMVMTGRALAYSLKTSRKIRGWLKWLPKSCLNSASRAISIVTKADPPKNKNRVAADICYITTGERVWRGEGVMQPSTEVAGRHCSVVLSTYFHLYSIRTVVSGKTAWHRLWETWPLHEGMCALHEGSHPGHINCPRKEKKATWHFTSIPVSRRK